MTRVLVVASGGKGKLSSIIQNQINSLTQTEKVEFRVFLVSTGIFGYVESIYRLARSIDVKSYELIHAHYALCGFVSSIASFGRLPVVCSLMGSDVLAGGIFARLSHFFAKRIWTATIVKSKEMKMSLGLKSVKVIPNGINLNLFQPLSMSECRKELNWNEQSQIVLFAANPKRPEKNFALAQQAFHLLDLPNKELKVLDGVDHNEMPIWMNASDVIVLTSGHEGSPNVIKEALACNRPIVSTDVGDVRERIGTLKGCYISAANPKSISQCILEAFRYPMVEGRQEVLTLDDSKVALSLLRLYEQSI